MYSPLKDQCLTFLFSCPDPAEDARLPVRLGARDFQFDGFICVRLRDRSGGGGDLNSVVRHIPVFFELFFLAASLFVVDVSPVKRKKKRM